MSAEQGAGDVLRSLRQAISDPGATVPREPNEPIAEWSARAVLASDWLASLLAATADSARADERGKVATAIAQAIEDELVCGCNGEDRHGGNICHWGAASARIARRIARDGGR